MCAHIAKYYGGFPNSVIYWKFDVDLLEPKPGADKKSQWDVEIVETPSDSGDECHRNIHGFGNGRAYNTIFKKRAKTEDMVICHDGKVEPFSWDRVRELKAALQ